MAPLYTKPKFLIGIANLFATGGATLYLKNKIEYSLEENEARSDEIEGTLRGHIGLIHEAHDRIEKKLGTAGIGAGGLENRDIYDQRGKDEKKDKKDNK
ncbi:hypothetical protein CB0940_04303 [Cercospora beticola]|uniref:Uncharacterized protein n=1 Tax=Cercospora beticola TaxID=122368 RepID=A0A2G5HML9_CERBT|nr:hypothetical protein CB0940_04303 [Cercospora beticola]PIA93806.1 hypothetical protein CB0940_04303 [Cercospora beticola]WPB01532.1 hypothetical protein RHO25_006158 [Cercospora beticola]